MSNKSPRKSLGSYSLEEMSDHELFLAWAKKYDPVKKPLAVLCYRDKTPDPRLSDEIPVPATAMLGMLSNPNAPDGDHCQLELFELGDYCPIRHHLFPAEDFPDIVEKFNLRIDWKCEAYLERHRAWRKKVEREMKEGFSMAKKSKPLNQRQAIGEFSKGLIDQYKEVAAKNAGAKRPRGKELKDRVEAREKPIRGSSSTFFGQPSKKFAEPLKPAATATWREDEDRLREQLLEAYQERATIQERLGGYVPDSDRFKPEKDRIREKMKILDELFQDAGAGNVNNWSQDEVQLFLVEAQSKCEARLAEIAQQRAREAKTYAEDAKKLKTVNARIKELHANGPDRQNKFDMDTNDEPVDGKTAAAGR